MQALDAYEEAIARDPASLDFLMIEAESQGRVVRARAELHGLVEHAPAASPLLLAVKQHLQAEQRRTGASQAFATLAIGLSDVEDAVAAARSAETELWAQWRNVQKSAE